MTAREIVDISGVSEAARVLAQDDSTPSSYLDSLEKQELYQDAVRFLAHKLPPDAGVKWGVRCLRELAAPERKDQKDAPLEASEAWIKSRDDAARFAAKEAADNTPNTGASNLVAMAVYMSGGSLTPAGAPEVFPPPYSAQKMIAGSVIVAVVSHEPQHANDRYKRALAMGKELDLSASP
jgi:hypothetical protein